MKIKCRSPESNITIKSNANIKMSRNVKHDYINQTFISRGNIHDFNDN